MDTAASPAQTLTDLRAQNVALLMQAVALQEQNTTLHDNNHTLTLEVSQLRLEVQQLTGQIDWFKRQVFGETSERVLPDPAAQPDLLVGLGVPVPAPKIEPHTTITYQRRTKQRDPDCVNDSGLRFDASVPVKTIYLSAVGEGEVIGEKITHRLGQRLSSHVVLRYIRPVVKQADGSLVTPAAPAAIFDSTLADVSFLAGMLVDKFLYHLPLHRQHQRLFQGGITLSRGTLTHLSQRTIELLTPIYAAQLQHVCRSRVLAMDEVPMKAGRKGPSKMRMGYFWPVYGEDHEVCFHFSPSRAHATVKQVLGNDFTGVLISDGYAAYQRYAEQVKSCTPAACWAHTRRGFEQALSAHPDAANAALDLIRAMYAQETQIRERNLTDENKLHYRTEHTLPIVSAFWAWCYEQRQRTDFVPSDPLAKALQYAWDRRTPLQVFLSDPDVPIDTNHLERALRVIPMGRKNYLFCWTELGAKHVGVIQSLIVTCKLHAIDPYVYLVDVLQRIGQHPDSRIVELTPRLWKQHFASNPLRSDIDDTS